MGNSSPAPPPPPPKPPTPKQIQDALNHTFNPDENGVSNASNVVGGYINGVYNKAADGIHQAQDVVINGVTMTAQMIDTGFQSFEDEVNHIGNMFNGVGGSIEQVDNILKKFSQIPTYVKEIKTQIDNL